MSPRDFPIRILHRGNFINYRLARLPTSASIVQLYTRIVNPFCVAFFSEFHFI